MSQVAKFVGTRRVTEGNAKPLSLLFLLCMILRLQVAHAQEVPPILDPDDVFTDAVEVVETLPILNADNETKRLYYWHSALFEWKVYEYPQYLTHISFPVKELTDGRYLLIESHYDVYAPNEYWVFDSKSGDTELLQDVACHRPRALSGEGRWILYQEYVDTPVHFCFTETGELTPPLPDSLGAYCIDRGLYATFGLNFEPAPSWESPDGRWIVFMDCTFPSDDYRFVSHNLYGYEFASGEIKYLGHIQDLSNVDIDHWLNNITPVINAWPPMFVSLESKIYQADVTHINSLELVGTLHPQTETPSGIRDTALAPDGHWLLVWDNENQTSISLLDVKTGKQTPITKLLSPEYELQPRWQESGLLMFEIRRSQDNFTYGRWLLRVQP